MVLCFLHPIIVQNEWSMNNWPVNTTCVSESNFSGSNQDGLPRLHQRFVFLPDHRNFMIKWPWWSHLPTLEIHPIKHVVVAAYRIKGLCKAYAREYPHKIWSCMVQYLHFRILEFPLIEPPIEALFLSLLYDILDLLFPGKDCLGGAPEIEIRKWIIPPIKYVYIYIYMYIYTYTYNIYIYV